MQTYQGWLVRIATVVRVIFCRTSSHSDVARVVRASQITFAKEHFVHDGYFEGRLPAPVKVNEEWYLKQYPDLRVGIRRGDFESAQKHVISDDYREGRRPFRKVASWLSEQR